VFRLRILEGEVGRNLLHERKGAALDKFTKISNSHKPTILLVVGTTQSSNAYHISDTPEIALAPPP
jgi:hypothetical protein